MLRLQGDFNGLFDDLLCLSHGEPCQDAAGNEVMLEPGMRVTAFEPDMDDDGNPADLVASGVVEPAPDWLQYAGSRWVLRIDGRGVRHEPSASGA